MTRKPEFITFTGVDDATNADDLLALAKDYPVEWGVLFSPGRQGVERRYPANAYWKFAGKGLRLAAHLCGGWSHGITEGTRDLPLDMSPFARVQVNYVLPQDRHIARAGAFAAQIRKPVIMQWRGSSAFPYQGGVHDAVSWLYDDSGGRGVRPVHWPRHPGKNRLVGYAGGITPANVLAVIREIDHDGLLSANATPYWIDMESGVRTEDGFDITKCRAVCEAVYGGKA
jgi:hypothetical protein